MIDREETSDYAVEIYNNGVFRCQIDVFGTFEEAKKSAKECK